MRARRFFALVLPFASLVGCRYILGIEEAELICPPETPDCKYCEEDGDCGSATECHSWTCRGNLCTPINAAAGSKCSRGVCSDELVASCVACLVDADCPSGGHCGDERKCFRCDDGVQNGREHGVDCGGPCKACLGEPCTTLDECKSGFCADSRCCTSACNEPCARCPLDGNCSAVPKYEQDNNPSCQGKNVCDGFGSCHLRPGEICSSDVDCSSYRCVNNRCAKLAEEACDFPQECVNDACVNGRCAM